MVLGVNNSLANAGEVRDVGSIPGSARFPEVGNGNALQYSCLENPHGQRSLDSMGLNSMGLHSMGSQVLDTTLATEPPKCTNIFALS